MIADLEEQRRQLDTEERELESAAGYDLIIFYATDLNFTGLRKRENLCDSKSLKYTVLFYLYNDWLSSCS